MTPKSEHQFIIGEMDPDSKVKEVTGVAGIDAYIVEYSDQEGKKRVSLAFVPKGAKAIFLLQQKINGVNVATSSSDWFNKSFFQYLDTHNLDASKISAEGVEQM